MKYRVTMYNTTYQRDETCRTEVESVEVLEASLELFELGGFTDITYEEIPECETK